MRKRNFLAICTTAGVVGMFALACADTPTTVDHELPQPGIPLFGLTEPFNGFGACMGEDSYAAGRVGGMQNPADLNCTANDIEIAQADLISWSSVDPQAAEFGGFEPFDPSEPVTCVEGQTIWVETVARLRANATERYDIGVWIANDGGDALTGSCGHWNLINGSPGVPDADGDSCGDMRSGTDALVNLGVLELTCSPNADGLLEVGACLGWNNNTNKLCPLDGSAEINYRYGTTPETKSKCNCEPFVLPITVLKEATLEVKKACVPTTDDGTFDLLINGDIEKDDAECGESTGKVTLGAGTNVDPGALHTFAEADFNTDAYTSSWKCTLDGSSTTIDQCGATGDAACSGSGTGPNTVQLMPEQDVVCTFTNERKASVVIKKVTVPAEDPAVGSFAFAQDFDATGSFNLGHNGTKTFTNIVPGVQKTVTETDPAPDYDLTNIACTGTAAANWSGTVATGQLQVTPQAGEAIECTFTNTKRGILRIAKSTVPTDDNTAFTFTPTGWNGGSTFDLAHGQTFSSAKLAPGNYSAAETVPGTFVLTNRACVHTGTANAKAFTSIADGVTVALGAGEDITCTFTNSRKAKLIVTKTIVGGGTQQFEFSRTGISKFLLGDGGSNDSGFALAPGTYRVCELDLAVSWSASATLTPPGGAATLINPDLPEDHGNRCVDVTLAYGDVKTLAWTNSPPPGGDARTIGYWRNWSSCTNGNQYLKAPEKGMADKTLDANLPQEVGDLVVDNCEDGVNILSKRDLTGSNKANDGAYDLAAQLLAAKLNVSTAAGICAAAAQAIADGQAFLEAQNFTGLGDYLRPGGSPANRALRQEALDLAAILDSYNNNTLCP